MAIAFPCPECTQPVLVHENWAGQPAGCPYCGIRFALPSVLGVPALTSGERRERITDGQTDWRLMTAEKSPRRRRSTIEAEDAVRGLSLIRLSCVILAVTTTVWYFGLMTFLANDNAFWKPVFDTGRIVIWAALDAAAVMFFFGLRTSQKIPDQVGVSRAGRLSLFFTRLAVAGIFLIEADLAIPPHMLLAGPGFYWLLGGTALASLVAHVSFIRFLQGIMRWAGYHSGDRAAGFYQVVLAMVVTFQIISFFVLAEFVGGQKIPADGLVAAIRVAASAGAGACLLFGIWAALLVDRASESLRGPQYHLGGINNH